MGALELGLAAAMALSAPAAADRPLTPPAPEFPEGAAWLNSEPFTLRRLQGRRVIVVSFFNSNALCSLRTFSTLKRWWEAYALEGLMVIGVHSPDYDFDRDPVYVRRALKRFGIKFPVVIDTRRKVWKAYSNEGWPAHFLIDPKGRIVFDRLGEGGLDEFEREILAALRDFNRFEPSAPRPEEPVLPECGRATRPVYLGSSRGGKVGLIRLLKQNALMDSRDGEVASEGEWTLEPDALRASEPGEKTRLRVIYRGAEALAVISNPSQKPAKVLVKQDNMWLHRGNANTDIRFDEQARSFLVLDESRLFALTRNRKDSLHELELYPQKAEIGVHGFEFPDFCRTDYPHP